MDAYINSNVCATPSFFHFSAARDHLDDKSPMRGCGTRRLRAYGRSTRKVSFAWSAGRIVAPNGVEEMPLLCRLHFLPNLDCRAEVPAGWRRTWKQLILSLTLMGGIG